jgi:cystathionine beta-lyase
LESKVFCLLYGYAKLIVCKGARDYDKVDATIAAFTHGGEWLDELREYIYTNKNTVEGFIKAEIPDIKAVPSEATYLMWIDCHKLTADTDKLAVQIREKTGLYISEGSQYGQTGKAFLRMNTACPRDTLMDGLERLKRGIIS